jgi:hypothetical protein
VLKIPQSEANKSANRWGNLRAKGGVVVPLSEGVCTEEFLSRKLGFLLSAMHSHAFCWFSVAPLVF